METCAARILVLTGLARPASGHFAGYTSAWPVKVAVGHETGLHAGPPGSCLHRGAWRRRYDLPQVVTPPLQVGEERGERLAAHHVRAAFGPLAVPDGGYAVKVGGDLDAAAVVCTEAGLAPDGSR